MPLPRKPTAAEFRYAAHQLRGIERARSPHAEESVTRVAEWLVMVAIAEETKPPGDGWHQFGTHSACGSQQLEFSGEDISEDGLPLWERVVWTPPVVETDTLPRRALGFGGTESTPQMPR